MAIDVKVKIVSDIFDLTVHGPAYATEGSAGMDLCACIAEPLVIKAGEILKVSTGIAIQLPDKNIGGFIFPRSGLSSKHGISMANCVGVLDSDYTGEILCPVINHSSKDYTINPGDRIAQIVFMPLFTAKLSYVDDLSHTQRGSGGFGSTGA